MRANARRRAPTGSHPGYLGYVRYASYLAYLERSEVLGTPFLGNRLVRTLGRRLAPAAAVKGRSKFATDAVRGASHVR